MLVAGFFIYREKRRKRLEKECWSKRQAEDGGDASRLNNGGHCELSNIIEEEVDLGKQKLMLI